MNEKDPSHKPFEKKQNTGTKGSKLNFFKKFSTSRIIFPEPDEEIIRKKLEDIKKDLPLPVIWLFGKTQSGKTSIIKALTGASKAEIGNGFQSCTKFSSKYYFPDRSNSLIAFLDTKGVSEVNYDPSDDIEAFIKITHMIIVVVKASDFALESLIASLKKIVRANKNIPVLIVQSHLHELYRGEQKDHISPCIYDEKLEDKRIPSEIKRTLTAQRKEFEKLTKHFAVIDFTLPDDGFSDPFYGIDSLLDKICFLLPSSYRMIFRQMRDLNSEFRKVFNEQAFGHILFYAITAGILAAVPLPFASLPLMSGVQVKMLHSVSSIYGKPLGYKIFREISATVGIGFLMRQGGRELLKFVPGVGSVVSAVYAASTTFALGMTFCYYFSLPKHQKEHQVLKEYYKEQVLHARKYFTRYFENYRKKQDE